MAFCQHCGAEYGAIDPGLTLSSVTEWREAFKSIGWWEVLPRDAQDRLSSILSGLGLPIRYDDPMEPWVFVAVKANSTWALDSIEAYGSRPGPSDVVMLMGTRSRIALVVTDRNGDNSRAYPESYTDLLGADVQQNGTVVLTFKDNPARPSPRLMKFKVKTVSSGIKTNLNFYFSKDTASRIIATDNLSAVANANMNGMGTIRDFFNDVLASS